PPGAHQAAGPEPRGRGAGVVPEPGDARDASVADLVRAAGCTRRRDGTDKRPRVVQPKRKARRRTFTVNARAVGFTGALILQSPSLGRSAPKKSPTFLCTSLRRR